MSISVLVVDDDLEFRGFLVRMLAGMGLRVVGEAGSVAEAMRAAADLRPDAALVDIGLPDGDGVALARDLAALPWRPRVVLVSTDPDATTWEIGRSAGAAGFIPKANLLDGALDQLLRGADVCDLTAATPRRPKLRTVSG